MIVRQLPAACAPPCSGTRPARDLRRGLRPRRPLTAYGPWGAGGVGRRSAAGAGPLGNAVNDFRLLRL